MKKALLVSAVADQASLVIWRKSLNAPTFAPAIRDEVKIGNANLQIEDGLTLSDFARLVLENKAQVTYTGEEGSKILKLLNAWRKALILSRSQSNESVRENLQWKFNIHWIEDGVAYIRMNNWVTGQSVDFDIVGATL